ncbi:hypothetical protein LCGC14_1607870 [marine sediment metagenome]|uniref:Uncharacterized protein n=1 Tax=marine sediment metagenome TaxID=412755 RepID=A0A0F9L9B9_9ZZZZ
MKVYHNLSYIVKAVLGNICKGSWEDSAEDGGRRTKMRDDWIDG